MKYLLLIAVVALVLWAMRRPALPPQRQRPRHGAPPALEQMVRCARCGLHLPRGEALIGADGRPYCSPAHRDAGALRTPSDPPRAP